MRRAVENFDLNRFHPHFSTLPAKQLSYHHPSLYPSAVTLWLTFCGRNLARFHDHFEAADRHRRFAVLGSSPKV